MTDIQYMPLKEVQTSGLLQEINRQFLNPLGLALAMLSRKHETGAVEYVALKVIDAREQNPAGLIMKDVGEDHIKRAENVAYLRDEIGKRRQESYGFLVQPLTSQEPKQDAAITELLTIDDLSQVGYSPPQKTDKSKMYDVSQMLVKDIRLLFVDGTFTGDQLEHMLASERSRKVPRTRVLDLLSLASADGY